MRTKILLVVMALSGMLTIQAQPKHVTWTKLDNPITNGSLVPTAAGTLAWGDYNNDGLLDAFLIAGQAGSDASQTVNLYKNNGDLTFTEIALGNDFFKLTKVSAVFIDYDNDGDLDLLVTGSMEGIPISFFFVNSGAPNYEFTELVEISDILPAVATENEDIYTHTLQAFDYNNDGWVDLLINGSAEEDWKDTQSGRVVALFKNNHGTFEYQSKPVNGTDFFRPINGGSLNVGDVNNDGYADIIITGWKETPSGVATDLYINNGNGTFRKWEASQTTFTGHQQGETFFIDINNDGWLDIVEIGRDASHGWNAFADMFINNKDLTFTKQSLGTTGGAALAAVGDINNDGWTDIFVSGWNTGSKFLYNTGNTSFEAVNLPDDETSRGGHYTFADFNNDHSLDFTAFGYSDGAGSFINNFYKNDKGNEIPDNQAPSAPTGVSVKKENGKFILSWNKATDDHTPQDAIRYNVAIDFKDGKKYAYVPSDYATGKIKVASGIPAFIMTNSIELNLPETGDYEFKVQAVDQANVGSAWSTVDGAQTGMKEVSSKVDATVQASQGMIKIVNEASGSAKYTILSVSGQIMQSGVCEAGSTVSSAFVPGIYLVKLSQGNATQTVKIRL